MRRGFRWAGIVLAAAALDLGARFALDLQLRQVLWLEAAIFIAAALALWAMYRRDPPPPGRGRAFLVVLIASFVLGALRAAIWGFGQPVTLANGTILALGVVSWLAWRARRWRGSQERGVEHANPSIPNQDIGT